MNTLGQTTKVVVTREESYSLNISFVSDAILPKGSLVRLLSTGHVSAATNADAFGIVTVGCKAVGEKVTVQTQFNTELVGKADGAVAIGDLLTTTGYDATAELSKYKVAATTNLIVAVALSAGADTEEVVVGVLRAFRVLD